MPPKRKIRDLSNKNDQMSFFDPVYQNDIIQISDDEDENDLLADGIPRPTFGKANKNESNETLDNDTIINSDQDQSTEIISRSKIVSRITQIQKSIHQARTMLVSMEKFKNIVPGSDEQREKLHSILTNLEEQQASYVNLLDLITLTEKERSAMINTNMVEPDDDDDDLSLRGNVQSPIRPRIESKIGFIPQALPTVLPTLNLSDNEQTNRNDYSNYDSLVGSLKSDTIIHWKDQQATSDDEASGDDVDESDKEMEKNLTLQKEQLRALQGQQRALLALKQRSEQQQKLTNQKSTDSEENDLLSDINNLRNRLKLLKNRYEKKYEIEMQQLQKSSKKPQLTAENRLKNLEHVRERLNELEQIVAYYQNDDTQDQQTINNYNTPKQLDTLSNQLTAKKLELEQAKSALSQLQQMVKQIQPDEFSTSTHSTPLSSKSNDIDRNMNQFIYNPQIETLSTNTKSSRLSNTHTPQQVPKSFSSTNNSVDIKMAAQHREIERLVESRSRLHTLKGQITSLHQSMNTPTIQTESYEDQLNNPKNIRPLYKSESEEDDDDDNNRIKQSNFCVSDNFINENELSIQMREVCRCLSTFIEEQKSFNRHIEERLTVATNSPVPQTTDPIFNQLQQQVLTQGLIVNLNTAYREIAVLQSEINALQSENNRLTSSISFDKQYHHQIPRDNSKESIYNFLPKIRPQSRSSTDEQLKLQNHIFENSSKTSFNSQSTGKQTAIHVEKINMETSNKQESSASQQKSSIHNLSNPYRALSTENLSNSFIIHRRPALNDNEKYNYKQKLDHQSSVSSIDDYQPLQELTFDDDDDNDNEEPLNDFPTSSKEINNVDLHTIDLQVKSIMVQLIPFMRTHINEIFNPAVLNHIHERILFLFKQQPDSAQLIRPFENQFADILEKAIEKYCETSIRECAADLIRDVSDVTFDELIKYKMYENTNTEQNLQPLINQNDVENENKYQIELAESENRPLTLIGSDEEDCDSDQEESQHSELETAVSRQVSNLHENESPISSDSNSNGHEYVLVNRSTSDGVIHENHKQEE
ncbi:unnamed protein product [Adineta steineri]|uniref:Pericentriolar material 1 protein C-terminal domain-containing protein n=1 Tax=Adineta steineri TaxID=433720 RepID=A0A815UVE9_9BILA|nr:unnamed protein product [Adineta steineri]CAF1527973.1 unnamed protein product [Adineta steineri]